MHVCELLPRQMVRETELDDVAFLVRTELSLDEGRGGGGLRDLTPKKKLTT